MEPIDGNVSSWEEKRLKRRSMIESMLISHEGDSRRSSIMFDEENCDPMVSEIFSFLETVHSKNLILKDMVTKLQEDVENLKKENENMLLEADLNVAELQFFRKKVTYLEEQLERKELQIVQRKSRETANAAQETAENGMDSGAKCNTECQEMGKSRSWLANASSAVVQYLKREITGNGIGYGTINLLALFIHDVAVASLQGFAYGVASTKEGYQSPNEHSPHAKLS